MFTKILNINSYIIILTCKLIKLIIFDGIDITILKLVTDRNSSGTVGNLGFFAVLYMFS